MMEKFLPRNDLDAHSVDSCIITNVIRKGNIIVFYDPERLKPQTLENLHGIGSSDTPFEGFVQQQKLGYAVILMKGTFRDPIVLLAWRRILPLPFMDQIKINMFMSKYRGQTVRKN
jgi:hypothetical protein